MTPQPTQLERIGEDRLRISWSDGSIREYAVSELRDRCPCATCREKRKAASQPNELNILSPEEMRPLTILGMKPTGTYAYGIDFSDGHNTGIYTFESLLAMGEEKTATRG